MPGRPKNERPGARTGRWVGRGHEQQEGRHCSGALVAGERLEEEGEGSGVGWAGATREGGSRIIRAPPGLQVTRPRLEPQWRAAPAPAINNSTHSQPAQHFWGRSSWGTDVGNWACQKKSSKFGRFIDIRQYTVAARQEWEETRAG